MLDIAAGSGGTVAVAGNRKSFLGGRALGGVAVGEIAADMDQRRSELVALALGEPGERLGARLVAECAHALEHGFCLGREIELPDAPVGRVLAALDPARIGHAVDQSAEGDRLDLEDLGKACLVDAFMPREMGENLPLRACQIEAARALVEALAHQPGYVVQEEAEGGIEFMTCHFGNIISKLVISKCRYPLSLRIPSAIDGCTASTSSC